MHTERIFLVARIRRCSRCGHPEDPLLPVRCAFDAGACPCRPAGCAFEGPTDHAANARLAGVLKRHGPSAIEAGLTGWIVTPDAPKKPNRPRPPRGVGPGPQKTRPERPRATGNWLDTLLDVQLGKGRG